MADPQIEEIKSRLDIADVVGGYVRLQKAGANWKALCPFHSEKTPSFTVSSSRQIWRCFGGCGEGGDVFSFVMKIESIAFGDALRMLAQRAGVALKRDDPVLRSERQKLLDISEHAAQFFERSLETHAVGREAGEYLKKRGLKDETVKEYRVGYAPEAWDALLGWLAGKGHKSVDVEKAGLAIQKQDESKWFDRFRGRIMFPIFDVNGQIIGFGGRIFSASGGSAFGGKVNEAKYVNSPQTLIYDKSRVLYGLHAAKYEIKRKEQCMLVEGYMDLIMCHQDGVKNAVAVSGTALTPFQLATLKRYADNLVLTFDMDEAGQKAADRGIDLARNAGFNVNVLTLSEGKDPADYVLSRPGELGKAVKEAKPIVEYYFEKAFGKFKPDTAEGKKQIAKILLPQLAHIPNKIEQAHWIAELANRLGVKEAFVVEELKRVQTNAAPPYEAAQSLAPRIPAQASHRSRPEVLGDHLVRVLLKHNQHVNLIDAFNFSVFPSLHFSSALEHLKKYQGQIDREKMYRDAPDSLREYLQNVELDIQYFEVKDPVAEIKTVFKNLRRYLLDNRMEEAQTTLGQAERRDGGGHAVAQLLSEYAGLMEERRQLEKE